MFSWGHLLAAAYSAVDKSVHDSQSESSLPADSPDPDPELELGSRGDRTTPPLPLLQPPPCLRLVLQIHESTGLPLTCAATTWPAWLLRLLLLLPLWSLVLLSILILPPSPPTRARFVASLWSTKEHAHREHSCILVIFGWIISFFSSSSTSPSVCARCGCRSDSDSQGFRRGNSAPKFTRKSRWIAGAVRRERASRSEWKERVRNVNVLCRLSEHKKNKKNEAQSFTWGDGFLQQIVGAFPVVGDNDVLKGLCGVCPLSLIAQQPSASFRFGVFC